MKLRELLDGAKVADFRGNADVEITGVTGDSRAVKAGDAFLCIRGSNTDGHTYLPEAASKGAAAAIVEYIPEDCALPCVVVEDARFAASHIFSNWRGNPEKSMKIVGVTGTNGKTSITYMLSRIFEDAGYRTGIIGTITNSYAGHTVNAGMTTPDPERLYAYLAEMRDHGVQVVFMEVSSHSLCLGRVDPIRFAGAVYTNLTPEHLDFHKTMENYARAKELLFPKSDLAVFNIDNDYVKAACGKNLCPGTTVSARQDADFRADCVEYLSMDGVRYRMKIRDGRSYTVFSPIPGEFTVYNTLCSLALAVRMGIEPETAVRAVGEIAGVPGRIERVTPPDLPFSVIIDYAHTPDALVNVIGAVRKAGRPGQKLTVLFGCGGDRDKAKRPVMGEIATKMADFTVITSDNCRSEDPDAIIADILKGVNPNGKYTVIPDRREAIRWAVSRAEDGEIVLIAGKGHEDYEIKKDGKHPFSEKSEVARALAMRNQSKG